ncbi:hypothetical protein [Acaryochloris marina]|uniref:hypothetical protein n=1 Tax=Acaryochloris marina TaxID=155978 RepID=UPI0021C265DA|nr:hypothetical protein [Acaryochloris marina]
MTSFRFEFVAVVIPPPTFPTIPVTPRWCCLPDRSLAVGASSRENRMPVQQFQLLFVRQMI